MTCDFKAGKLTAKKLFSLSYNGQLNDCHKKNLMMFETSECTQFLYENF